jgi:hypothetical protein
MRRITKLSNWYSPSSTPSRYCLLGSITPAYEPREYEREPRSAKVLQWCAARLPTKARTHKLRPIAKLRRCPLRPHNWRKSRHSPSRVRPTTGHWAPNHSLIGFGPLARNDWSLAFGSRRSTGRVDLCPPRIASCCSRSRMANCWILPAHSRCLREPMTSYRVRYTASRSQRPRQDHLPRRPAFDLSLMFHLRKSRIGASPASTHSSRLAASRACDRNLCAETQQTSCLGRLDECHVSPRFAAVHFS